MEIDLFYFHSDIFLKLSIGSDLVKYRFRLGSDLAQILYILVQLKVWDASARWPPRSDSDVLPYSDAGCATCTRPSSCPVDLHVQNTSS